MFTTLHNKMQILQSLEISQSTLSTVKTKFLNLKKKPWSKYKTKKKKLKKTSLEYSS